MKKVKQTLLNSIKESYVSGKVNVRAGAFQYQKLHWREQRILNAAISLSQRTGGFLVSEEPLTCGKEFVVISLY